MHRKVAVRARSVLHQTLARATDLYRAGATYSSYFPPPPSIMRYLGWDLDCDLLQARGHYTTKLASPHYPPS